MPRRASRWGEERGRDAAANHTANSNNSTSRWLRNHYHYTTTQPRLTWRAAVKKTADVHVRRRAHV
jgi:hypothetical protein